MRFLPKFAVLPVVGSFVVFQGCSASSPSPVDYSSNGGSNSNVVAGAPGAGRSGAAGSPSGAAGTGSGGTSSGGTSSGGTSSGGSNDGGTSPGGASSGGSNDGGTSSGGGNDGGGSVGVGGSDVTGGAGGTLGSAGSDSGGKGGRGGKGGAGGSSAGGGSGGSTSAGGSTGSGGSGGMTVSPLGDTIAITWYSFQDNTPVNSAQSASGNRLIPFVTVAVPFRFLTNCAGNTPKKGITCGTLNFGDKLFLTFMKGQKMPNGQTHSGWVEIQDFCGDSGSDSYCFQKVNGKSYPNVDMYIGDFPTSGMKYTNGDCQGPAGNGQQVTTVFTGNPGSQWFNDYGGKALGSGKCGDYASAEANQGGLKGGCWDYTPPANDFCSSCMTGIDCN